MLNLIGVYVDDRYQIIKKIGEGGMGVVFSAVDVQSDQTLALKIMRKKVIDPKARDRFLREVQTLAKVSSPHIIQVYAFGRDMPRGLLYAAMELAEGNDLLDLLKVGRLSLPLAVQVIEETCRALIHIHSAGIFHRDLKPSNIKIVPIGPKVISKILDFGLVRLADGENLTEQGQAPGTISYMSPEELGMGTTRAADHRIDLYKLGIIVYEMLTGQKPYQGQSPIETAQQILEEKLPKISDIIDDIPESIDRFTQKLMAKDPDDRFQSADLTLEALNLIASQLSLSPFKCEHQGKSEMVFSDFKLISHPL